VIGIVASRIVERFHRPTVMVAVKGGAGRGSARSIERFHLFEALQECSTHLSKLGGHQHAAGLSIDLERLPAFTTAFEQAAARRLSEEDLVPCCRVDAVVSLPDLSEDSLEAIQRLAPFGQGNPEPVFASWRVATRPRLITSKREGYADHLKLSIDGVPRLSAIGFGMADRMSLNVGPVDLAFQLTVDEWQGVSRLSLRLKDLRAAS
jgi:single-stranded-DNA-specific exonuclease